MAQVTLNPFAKTGTDRIRKVKDTYTKMVNELDKGAEENEQAMLSLESEIALLQESINLKMAEKANLESVNKEATELKASIKTLLGI